jgi:cobalt transporter subunit CbtB
MPLAKAGKAEVLPRPASQETGHARRNHEAVGCDGKEMRMNTLNTTKTAATSTTLISAVFVALLGATLVFIAGHAQSATLHDAAHDTRHAVGFPCH